MPESAAPATGGASAQLKSIQVLRAVAALGVLTLHVANEKIMLFGGGPGPFQNFLLGAAGVDLFFIISGFVMVYSSESLFGRADAPKIFFLRRLARIAPLYWAVTIAIIAYIYAAHGAKLLGDLLARGVLRRRSCSGRIRASTAYAFPVHLLGWTLNYEMFFYAVFAARDLAAAAARGARGDACVRRAGAARPCCHVAAAVQLLGQLDHPGVLPRHADRLAYREGVRLPPAAAWALGIAALAGYAAAWNPPHDWGGWRVFWWGLPSAALVAACVLSSAEWQPGPVGRFFGLLGDASYSLYLVHPLVFPLVRWTIVRWIDFSAVPWLYAATLFVAAIVASVACYLFFERPITRVLQRRLRAWQAARVA